MEKLGAVVGDEDLFVVIVGDGDDDNRKRRKQIIRAKKEIEDESSQKAGVEGLIETAEKYGELIPLIDIKEEPEEYLVASESEELEAEFIGDDTDKDYIPDDNEEEYSEEEPETEVPSRKKRFPSAADKEVHRYKMRRPEEQQSFVKELCEHYPELAADKKLLVDTLCEMMVQMKPPEPPRDYFIMNDINFECSTCGAIKDSLPAVGRHWQEKHGPRYLVCYACGVDFRSKTNLYKHEKRCRAKDAVVVLQARARFVGSKGRSRPFLLPPGVKALQHKKKKNRWRFCCEKCPADFTTWQALQSHEYAHLGVRPYQCEECTLSYTSATALSRHQSSKHGDQKYICDHCSRPFNCRSSIIQHLNSHRPLRRFCCDMCGRRFAQRLALQLHVDKIHYQLPPPCACQICPKRYPRMSLLKTHMLRAHGMNLITKNMFYKALPHLTETQLQHAKIVMKSDRSQERRIYDQNLQGIFNKPSKTTFHSSAGETETS